MGARVRAGEKIDPAKERLRLWLRLLKVTRMTQSVLRENLRAQFGSTLPRFDVMSALNRHQEGLMMNQISSMLKTSNGNVTGIVNRLVEDGLVSRDAVPGDRRVLQAKLTTKGKQEFARQAVEHERWIDDLLGSLVPDEASQMLDSLDPVVAAIEDRTNVKPKKD